MSVGPRFSQVVPETIINHFRLVEIKPSFILGGRPSVQGLQAGFVQGQADRVGGLEGWGFPPLALALPQPRGRLPGCSQRADGILRVPSAGSIFMCFSLSTFLRSELWGPQRDSCSFKIPHMSFSSVFARERIILRSKAAGTRGHQDTLHPFPTLPSDSVSCRPHPRADRPAGPVINAASAAFQRRFKKLPFWMCLPLASFQLPSGPTRPFRSFLGFPIVQLHGTF